MVNDPPRHRGQEKRRGSAVTGDSSSRDPSLQVHLRLTSASGQPEEVGVLTSDP